MAFNSTTLLRETSQDLVFGLRETIGAFADMVCTHYSRDSLSGTEPVFATADALSQAATGKVPGSAISERNAELTSVTWDMQEFSKMFPIPLAVLKDLDQYIQGGASAELVNQLVLDVDAGIDLDLVTLLTSATYNNSQGAATGVWSLNTSTPILDLQNACDKTPGADMLILGHTSARELARHPDTKERISNYSGKGAIGFEQLKGILGEALQIDPSRVFIFSKFRNSANEGQAATIARLAGDLAWVGHSRGLRKYEQTYESDNTVARNGGIVSVEPKHNRVEIAYIRNLDIVRADKDLGCYLTGI